MSKFFKTSESNIVTDFIAGADPTGRATFELSKNNKKHHLAHNVSGAIGGFTVGALATAGLTGLGTIGLGKLIKGKLGKELSNIGKDSLIIFNPKKTKNAINNFTKGIVISRERSKLWNRISKIKNENPNWTKVIKKLKPPSNKEILEAPTVEKAKELLSIKNAIIKHDNKTNKFIKTTGTDPVTASIKGGAAIGGLAAAGIGGGLNALSSISQYNVGQQFRKLKEKNNE